MPPANSPVQGNTPPNLFPTNEDPATSRGYQDLQHHPIFTSTVISDFDYHNQQEEDIAAENVAFLRTELDSANTMPSAPPTRDLSRELRDLRRRREVVQGMRINSGMSLTNGNEAAASQQIWHDPSQHQSRSAYGQGAPGHQSLFDWAPAGQSDASEYTRTLQELSREQPNTHPDVLNVLARARVSQIPRNAPSSHTPANQGPAHEPSLRSAAILQSFRRNRTFARSRDIMSRMATAEGENHAIEPVPTSRTASSSNTRALSTASPRPHGGVVHQPDMFAAARVTNHFDERDRDRSTTSRNTPLGGFARRPDVYTAFTGHFDERDEDNSTSTHPRLVWSGTPIALPHMHSPDSIWSGAHQSSRERAENLEALRRRYLENPGSGKMSEFERIIKYLHWMREADDDAMMSISESANISRVDQPLTWNDPSQLKVYAGCPPSRTSWLAPGASFSGTQQTHPNPSSAATMHRLVHDQPRHLHSSDSAHRPFDGAAPHWLRHMSTSELLSTYPVSAPTPQPSAQCTSDRWAVNMSIYNVDYETMTLQGTMEAYNVPSMPLFSGQPSSASRPPSLHQPHRPSSAPNPSPPTPPTLPTPSTSPASTPFTTYVEGQIIDFSNHTLLTEPEVFGVRTTPDTDASYWRRLEPFAKLTDDEIAKRLLDRTWIEKELMGKYVLMRWKERCFIPPSSCSGASSTVQLVGGAFAGGQAAGHSNRSATTSVLSGADGNGYGLSISGFYYVSLRRRDGKLEGLYYDPQSSPYQHLELRPRGGGWGSGSWGFR